MTHETSELNIDELDAVSGGWVCQQIVDYLLSQPTSMPITVGSGSGSGSGDGFGSGSMGSGSGRPTCPGCHGPA